MRGHESEGDYIKQNEVFLALFRVSSGSSDEVELEKPPQCLQLPTQLPTRQYLSLKEGDDGLHYQKSGYYGVVRLRNDEMMMRQGWACTW